jgi:hypothetical protein|tara:strand:- start:231 stop:353 length:123 start_codon:yes stop_codon:yes gene_type:complete
MMAKRNDFLSNSSMQEINLVDKADLVDQVADLEKIESLKK